MIEALLVRLEKVTARGSGFMACCPAHDDSTPSLGVRELEDGTVLVHCFGGCSVEQVLSAVGLEFDALFPPKTAADRTPRVRVPFNAADVLEALDLELMIVQVCAADMAQGKTIEEGDLKRLALAADRINDARALARGER